MGVLHNHSAPRIIALVVLSMLAGLIATPTQGAAPTIPPIACGDGRVDQILEDFETTPLSAFTVFKADPAIPDPALSLVPGCQGQALSFGYDLTNASQDNQSWIVLQKSFPERDFSAYTHLRVALRGGNLDSHHHVEVKLWDGNQTHAVTLPSMTDLPVWRAIYIDLRELQNTEPISLTTISRYELAVVRCDGNCEVADVPPGPQPPVNDLTGTLFIDEIALVDLKPGAPHRVVQTTFETVPLNPEVAERAAAAIRNQTSTSSPTTSLVPAWFPEQNPNFNTYAQAEALLVFTYAYAQFNDVAYRDAARALAQKLLALQIPAGKLNAGAWHTTYDQSLLPPLRSLPEGTTQRCDGDEQMVTQGQTLVANNLDTCQWVGNVGWMLIALGRLQRSGIYTDTAALDTAIQRGADWVIAQVGRHPEYPELITPGTEGNLSAYFGLLAAGKRSEAGRLGNAIFQKAWDAPLRRIKPGAGPVDVATALDVSGSWGAAYLWSLGRTQKALESQGYTASIMRITAFDGSVDGYGDIAGPYTVAVEFTAQAAVAGITDAAWVMEEIYPLQIANGPYAGAFPGATDHWYGGTLLPWSTTMAGVSPTAWVFFAAAQIDPLLDDYRFMIMLPMLTN